MSQGLQTKPKEVLESRQHERSLSGAQSAGECGYIERLVSTTSIKKLVSVME